jgi:hypothetical protein
MVREGIDRPGDDGPSGQQAILLCWCAFFRANPQSRHAGQHYRRAFHGVNPFSAAPSELIQAILVSRAACCNAQSSG